MTDCSIEEEFEEALAKEVVTAGKPGSLGTQLVTSKIFEGFDTI